MLRLWAVLTFVLISGCTTAPVAQEGHQPEISTSPVPSPIAMPDPLKEIPHFSSLEELVRWTGANFKYDSKRLYDTTAAEGESRKNFVVRSPVELFQLKTGICTDLAHFGVQVARRDQLSSAVTYLKLYLKPRKVRGHVVSRHWMAIAQTEDGLLRFFADSRNPGRLSPPYGSVDSFLKQDPRYRFMEVTHFEVRDHWNRTTKKVQFLGEKAELKKIPTH